MLLQYFQYHLKCKKNEDCFYLQSYSTPRAKNETRYMLKTFMVEVIFGERIVGIHFSELQIPYCDLNVECSPI